MNIYFSSILLIVVGIIAVTPLTIEKNYFKYSLPLFYLIIILSTLFRPYMPEGIDNKTFIDYLSNQNLTEDIFDIKMSLVYYLTRLIPGTWQKIYMLNILSSSMIIFSFNKIFKNLIKQNTSKYLILLYLVYILIIIPPLLLVHLKQYLGFGFFSILIYLYSINKKKVIIFEILISLLVIFSHVIYFPSIVFYFFSKYLGNRLKYFWNYSSNINKIFYLLLFLIFICISYISIDTIYKLITTVIPGYYTYGVQLNMTPLEGSSFGFLYVYILIFPIIFFNILGVRNNDNNNQFSLTLIFFLLFSIPISFIEFKLPILYAISRIKSGIYPIVFLLLFDLKDKKISKFNSIPLLLTIYIISIHSILRTRQYLIP